jgi:hypothetical protein
LFFAGPTGLTQMRVNSGIGLFIAAVDVPA